ncbi:MAG: ABC transporter permease [Hyphomicrobiales bacterium]|nr:MAG: ABC transporter permease [Hyphomicrobiales bacterium]
MWYYIARRIAYAIPIAIGVTVFCFALVFLAPGNPVQMLLPADASQEVVDLIMKTYGFDRPLPVQYWTWLMRAVVGDLGVSIQSNRPVIDEVLRALANTVFLSFGAVMLAFSIAFVLGTLAAYYRGSATDRGVTALSIVGVSIPNYWLGIVLVIIFAVELNWLPATGMGPGGSETFDLFNWSHFKHVILPIITLCMVPVGMITRTTRSAVSEVLGNEFVNTLRAKGLDELAVIRHALKNAMPQILAVMGLQFGYLMGGSILVETIFNWPGTGFLLNKAILTRDIPVLQGTILILALVFVVTNLIVDLFQTAVDPRIKRS